MLTGTGSAPTFVFVHGFLGLDRVSTPVFTAYYFRGVDGLMSGLGVPWLTPRLPRAGSVEVRARHLAAAIEASGARRVVLVGHSMGGLDSRFVASRLDPQRRVQAVVTVATPHRGSPLAEGMLAGRGPLSVIGRRFMRPALEDLRPGACARFNRDITDRADVRYLSYGAVRVAAEVPLWARPWSRDLERLEGPNDAQVSETSAKWGDYRGTVRADHWELIGWNLGRSRPSAGRPFPHLEFYRNLVGDVLGAA